MEAILGQVPQRGLDGNLSVNVPPPARVLRRRQTRTKAVRRARKGALERLREELYSFIRAIADPYLIKAGIWIRFLPEGRIWI